MMLIDLGDFDGIPCHPEKVNTILEVRKVIDSDEIATDERNPLLSYMTVREANSEQFPMSPILIHKEQMKDKELQQSQRDDKSKRYSIKKVEGVSLIHFEGNIFVPKSLCDRIIAWYHIYLVHPGKTRMEATIRQIFTWPWLKPQVEE
jgi:hypothetical protein